jgi:hypothetical protein
VEDHKLFHSRRLLGLSLVTLELAPPPLRRKLDQQGSFEATRSHEIVPDQHPEEITILDVGAKALGPYETPTTNILTPIIVPIHPYVCQTVSHATMETNASTSSRNSSIPTMVVTTGDFPPPNPPSLVRSIPYENEGPIALGVKGAMATVIDRIGPPWSQPPPPRAVVQSCL